MTIEDLREQLDSLETGERAAWCRKLFPKLSPISHSSLNGFERDWCRERGGWEDFKKAQNLVFRMCIDMECSVLGQDVRKAAGLDPLNLQDEL